MRINVHKVDPSKILALVDQAKKAKEKKAAEEQEAKKRLLQKRMEMDGGTAARRMLANQKATVKVS